MKRVHFEDNGQDFLRWTIDGEGMVVACQPFQEKVWIGTKVLNHQIIKPGDELFLRLKDGHQMNLRHLVESVEFVGAPPRPRAIHDLVQPQDYSSAEAY